MTVTVEHRVLTVPSWATAVGRFYIEDPRCHAGRIDVASERVATMTAQSVSASTRRGVAVHVFNDRGQVVGYARDGVWHPAASA